MILKNLNLFKILKESTYNKQPLMKYNSIKTHIYLMLFSMWIHNKII